jgi:hypothetical protein
MLFSKERKYTSSIPWPGYYLHGHSLTRTCVVHLDDVYSIGIEHQLWLSLLLLVQLHGDAKGGDPAAEG